MVAVAGDVGVAQGEDSVLIQWTRDSAYRFFPLVQHEEFGLVLHPFDLATNKTLALVGRLEVRDWIDLITYLSNNRDRVDYPRYRDLGLPIGSGEVEARCKVLVQARCKQSGMRWSKRGAEQVLRVRCALRDGTFDSTWDHPGESIAIWHRRYLRHQRKEAA
ncbi:hypothetical protein HQ563_08715 [bacterium]|nr:hypothetical protein [bacterium]